MASLHPPAMPASTFSSRSNSAPRARTLDLRAGGALGFLSAFAGEPRGFWGRGTTFLAWGGELGRVELGPGEARFSEVREGARHLLAEHDLTSFPVARLFGGFSFLEGGGGDAVWQGFPTAAFILPRWVLEGGEGLLRLTDLSHESSPDAFATMCAAVGSGNSAEGARSIDPPARRAPRDFPGPTGRGDEVDHERWRHSVARVLSALEAGQVRKAVLARTLDAVFPHPVDPLRSLDFLRRENRDAHVFYFEMVPGRVLLGAAPELLAQLRDGQFEATAVAGSIPRGGTETEDRVLAHHLLQSPKDRMEHRLTVEEMREVLADRLESLEVEEEPHVLRLARIQHLESRIRGGVREGEDVLTLVEALHPTPAVCGRPRAEALALIRESEPFDRGWYAGPVGWFDLAGGGEFVPALRAAVGGGTGWRLFAGAGIVPGSEAEAEWDEIDLKFEPALRALTAGVGAVSGVGAESPAGEAGEAS